MRVDARHRGLEAPCLGADDLRVDQQEGPIVALPGGIGTFALLANMVRLPRWASQRQRQMEHVAAKATLLLRGHGDQTEKNASPSDVA